MSYKKQKLELVQESMRTNNIECTVIPLGINFRWLFEFFGEQSDRFIVAIIYQEGAPILITPEYEKAALCNATGITDSIGWYEEENPITSLTEKISHINGSIALDPQMWFSSFYHISYKLPKKEYISAETIFNSLRAVKDNDEQEYLTKASQQTANAIIETLYELKIGITEGEVLKILKDKFNRISSSPNYTEVSFGENTAILPCFSTIKKLQKNDVVVIDAGLTINDYWGDITITSVFGKATSNFKNIYNIVKKANSLAKDVAALNTRACDVDKAARDYITKKGYEQYFTHRTGHGLGLEIHEEPYIVEKNLDILVPGNVFTIEPGIYLPKKFGVRIEDDIIKKNDGIHTSKIPREELLEIG